jgi:hypothetical protein
MQQGKQAKHASWLTIVVMGLVVFAFMALSLSVTATGTSRFAIAMGYDAKVGYAVGVIFDIAKAVLPLALLTLSARRALGISIILGVAWIGLVTYSVLATHATISTAISAIEQNGTRKMEVRGNLKAELNFVEQQLAALIRPTPPRPTKSVRAALAATSVPPGIWKDSRECAAIQESAYFAKACAQVVQLRTELTAAQDYEHLSGRANELRERLAETPIIATSDPLPTAFSATLGRLLPVGGTEGLAMLLTMVVEIISCFGLAGLRRLCISGDQTTAAGKSDVYSLSEVRDDPGRAHRSMNEILPEPAKSVLPSSSQKRAAACDSKPRSRAREERAGSSSNVVQKMQAPSSPQRSDAAPQGMEGGSAGREDVCSPSVVRDDPGREQRGTNKILPESAKSALPSSSLKSAAVVGYSKPRNRAREEHAGSSSNVVQMRHAPSSLQRSDTARQLVKGGSAGSPCTAGSHVTAFVQDRLRITPGPSVGATDLRYAYIAWCTKYGYTPLLWQKFSAELEAMGFTKWKSCGRMRYRDLQLVA